MKSKSGLLLVLLMSIFAVAVSIFFTGKGLISIKVDPDLTTKGTSFLLTYFFLIAAIERASAVFVGIQRGPEQKTWQSRVARLTELLNVGGDSDDEEKIPLNKVKRSYKKEKRIIDKLVKEKGIIPIEPVAEDEKDVSDYVGYLTAAKQAYQFQLSAYNAETTKLVTRMVFVAGIFMAAVGLSILEDLLVPGNMPQCDDFWTCLQHATNPVVPQIQQIALRISDIIITGGLIGGGSKSFNSFLNSIDQYVNKTPV